MRAQARDIIQTSSSVREQVLTFTVAGERYGVGVLQVRELRRYAKPTRVPQGSSAVLGIINVRGVVIPVADLRLFLGLEPIEHTRTSVVILLNVKTDTAEKIIGLAVEEVTSVEDVPLASRSAPPEGANEDVIESICSDGDKLLIIIKIDQMLGGI